MKKYSFLIVLSFLFCYCQKDNEEIINTKEEPKAQATLKVHYSGSFNGLNQGVLRDTVGKTASFLVETNQKDWSFRADKNDKLPNSEKWLDIKKNGNTLLIEAKDNFTDYDRSDIITISVNNGELIESKVMVQYSYDPPLKSFIPDVYFREKVKRASDYFTIESRRMAKIWAVELNIDGIFIKDDIYIKSLDGIDALLNLQYFVCKNSNLKTIRLPNSPKLGASLFDNHLLESVDLNSLDSIRSFGVVNSKLLNVLDVSDLASLKSLTVSNNSIQELDLSYNRNLEVLVLQEADLKKINVSENNKLKRLDFGGKVDFFGKVIFESDIDEIDLSQNNVLQYLYFTRTNVKSLDLKNNPEIEIIECSNNLLETIDVTGSKKIKKLNCSNNNIKLLDISNSPDLLHLDCTNNPIEIVYVNEAFDLNNPLPTFKIPPTAIFKKK